MGGELRWVVRWLVGTVCGGEVLQSGGYCCDGDCLFGVIVF